MADSLPDAGNTTKIQSAFATVQTAQSTTKEDMMEMLRQVVKEELKDLQKPQKPPPDLKRQRPEEGRKDHRSDNAKRRKHQEYLKQRFGPRFVPKQEQQHRQKSNNIVSSSLPCLRPSL